MSEQEKENTNKSKKSLKVTIVKRKARKAKEKENTNKSKKSFKTTIAERKAKRKETEQKYVETFEVGSYSQTTVRAKPLKFSKLYDNSKL